MLHVIDPSHFQTEQPAQMLLRDAWDLRATPPCLLCTTVAKSAGRRRPRRPSLHQQAVFLVPLLNALQGSAASSSSRRQRA